MNNSISRPSGSNTVIDEPIDWCSISTSTPEATRRCRHDSSASSVGTCMAMWSRRSPSDDDADSEVVGMDSMTMPFPLADPALAAGLAAGDRIEMEFEVRWNGDDPLLITALEKLPPETRLAFEESPGAGEGTPSP